MTPAIRPTLLGCHPGGDGDVVVMGFPFDHGTVHHLGSHAAPSALRACSVDLSLRDAPLWDAAEDRELCGNASVSDLGDIAYRVETPRHEYLARLETVAARVAATGKRPLSLGGDHLITLPLVRGLLAVHEELQLVHVDAHADYAAIRGSELPTHATFVAHLLASPGVRRVVQVGVRGVLPKKRVLPERIRPASVSTLAESLLPGVPVYLTIDTDAFDPSIAPGVGYPVPGGLQWADLAKLLAILERHDAPVVGADWVEYNPEHDTRNRVTAIGVITGLARVTHLLGAHVARFRKAD